MSGMRGLNIKTREGMGKCMDFMSGLFIRLCCSSASFKWFSYLSQLDGLMKRNIL